MATDKLLEATLRFLYSSTLSLLFHPCSSSFEVVVQRWAGKSGTANASKNSPLSLSLPFLSSLPSSQDPWQPSILNIVIVTALRNPFQEEVTLSMFQKNNDPKSLTLTARPRQLYTKSGKTSNFLSRFQRCTTTTRDAGS